MNILFVCTGNTCRSPMAEGLAAALAPHVVAASAGTEAEPGLPASDGAIAAMRDIGIDISDHRSRTIEEALTAGSPPPDLIFALEPGHAEVIRGTHPELATRVHVLKSDGSGIADPHSGDEDDYETARDDIRAAILSRVEEW